MNPTVHCSLLFGWSKPLEAINYFQTSSNNSKTFLKTSHRFTTLNLVFHESIQIQKKRGKEKCDKTVGIGNCFCATKTTKHVEGILIK